MAIIHGDGGENFLTGTNNDDTIYGYGWNDQLSGRGGKDRLFGGSGADQLGGDDGADVLDGGVGSDELWGGAGPDKFDFRKGTGTDFIKDWQNGTDRIRLDVDGVNRFSDVEVEAAGYQGVNGVKITWGTGDLVFIGGFSEGAFSGADFIFI